MMMSMPASLKTIKKIHHIQHEGNHYYLKFTNATPFYARYIMCLKLSNNNNSNKPSKSFEGIALDFENIFRGDSENEYWFQRYCYF